MSFPGAPYRNIAEARVLKDQLSFRLASAGLTVVASQDVGNNPVLTITTGGAWATGAQYAVIQIVEGTAQANINVDVLGLTQTVYTPEIIRVNVEGNTFAAGAVPTSSDFTSVLSFANSLQIFGAVLGFGTRVEVWNSGHGTQPAILTGNPPVPTGTLVASFDDLFNPMTSTM